VNLIRFWYNSPMVIVFHSKLSKAECIFRIKANAEENTILANLSTIVNFDKGFFYKIDGDDLTLKKVIYYRNSFQSIFYGEFVEESKGTRIEGYFSMHILVKIFMGIWFGGVTLMGVIEFTAVPSVGIIGYILMLVFGIFIIIGGKYMGKKQEKEIVEFIEKTLEAKIEKN